MQDLKKKSTDKENIDIIDYVSTGTINAIQQVKSHISMGHFWKALIPIQ